MSTPFKLSIIIPVYNVSNYINQCVTSLFIPEYKEMYEILLINDGSTDNSEFICKEIKAKYKSFHIQVISKKNGGLSSARNTGIEHSKGEYLFFLDGDDYVDSVLFEEFLSKIWTFDSQVIMNNYQELNDQTKELTPVNLELNNPILENADKNLFIQYIMNNVKNSMWSAWKFVVKRGFILEKSLYFGENLLCEDIDWTTRMLLNLDTISYSHNNYYIYRTKREGSIINTVNLKKELDVVSISYHMIQLVNNCNCINEYTKMALTNKLLVEIFILSLMHIQLYKKADQEQLLSSIISKRDVLRFSSFKKMKIVKASINIMGCNLTSKLLYYRYKFLNKGVK